MPRRPDLTALPDWIENSLREAGWAPLLVFGIHVMALGAFNAYERFPYVDLPMHFFGGVVTAFFFHRVSINASLWVSRGHISLRGIDYLCLLLRARLR